MNLKSIEKWPTHSGTLVTRNYLKELAKYKGKVGVLLICLVFVVSCQCAFRFFFVQILS